MNDGNAIVLAAAWFVLGILVGMMFYRAYTPF